VPTREFFAARGRILVVILLVLAVIALYWRTKNYGYVNYDDDSYIVNNAWVKAGLTRQNMMRAFTTIEVSNWHPLTWLSYMAGCELFGPAAGGQHVINLALHAASAALLFLALHGATGRLYPSALTAALFALHPLNVESVAWVSERKGALSTFFWMLTLWFYLRYVRQPDVVRYLLVFLSMALGLMAKQMLLTMPFILLLLDYWPLARVARPPASIGVRPIDAVAATPPASVGVRPIDAVAGPSSASFRVWLDALPAPTFKTLVVEKIPLVLLSLVFIPIVFYAQSHGGAIIGMDVVPLKLRVSNALISYLTYMKKIVLPYGLSVFYPYFDLAVWKGAAAFLVLIAASVVALKSASRRPYVFVGWAWFVGSLVPVIKLVQLGSSSTADRYTYIPAVGLFTAFAWYLDDYAGKFKNRTALLAGAAVVILMPLMLISWRQVSYWKNTTSLFTHASVVTENNYLAHSVLGAGLLTQGKPREALVHLDQAYRSMPRDFVINLSIARALSQLGNQSDSEAYYRRALEIKSNVGAVRGEIAAVMTELAVVVSRQGRHEEALKLLYKAMELEPAYAEAYYEAGNIFYAQGRFREAAKQFAAADYLKPSIKGVGEGLKNALRKLSK
jgi:tetratricopeptide (TPR) repeat protein